MQKTQLNQTLLMGSKAGSWKKGLESSTYKMKIKNIKPKKGLPAGVPASEMTHYVPEGCSWCCYL